MEKKLKSLSLSKFFSQPARALVFLLLLSLILRLYKIGDPVADWHSFRQADTISVAWEYYRAMVGYPKTQSPAGADALLVTYTRACGFACLDLLRPQYQDLSNIQSGEENLAGWRMVEWPIVSAAVAAIMYILESEQAELIYRLVDIGFSLLSVAGVYLLVEKVSGRKLTAFLAALALAILPYSVFYSRTILPEVALITGQIWSLYFFMKLLAAGSHRERWCWLVVTAVTLALTLLIKPVAVFLAPVLIYLVWQKQGWQALKKCYWYVLAAAALAPLILWRKWIVGFPSGIPSNDWLLQGQVKALSVTWWRWLGVERFVKMILGLFGSVVALGAIFGLGKNRSADEKLKRWRGFLLTYLLGSLLFLIVFASGNVQHDYYQNFILPSLVVALAAGLTVLIDKVRQVTRQQRPAMVGGILLALVLQIAYFWLVADFDNFNLGQTIGWRLPVLMVVWLAIFVLWVFFLKAKQMRWQVFLIGFFLAGTVSGLIPLKVRILDFYKIHTWAGVEAGRRARELLPTNARVIAPYQGDTTLLWQTRRRGWPIGFEIETKIASGATHYLTVNFDDEANELAAQYETLVKTEDYLILDLTKPL